MVSLTPQQHSENVTSTAFKEGAINGSIALIPSFGAIWLAMKNARFEKATNWQSRTALVLMPGLFTFAFTAELSMEHQMAEMASRNEHIRSSAVWAERKHDETYKNKAPTHAKDDNTEAQLMQLYRQSVADSGVRVVNGAYLGPHHRLANFWQEHPFRVLAALSIPTVGYIFYGRSGQEHLQFQSKLMHTRVYGQFAVICMLLSLMGFKSYMDSNGKFITEADAEQRALEMAAVRESLLERLHLEKEQQARFDAQLRMAHDEDVQTGHVHTHGKKKAKKGHEKVDLVKDIDSVTV